MKLLTVLLGASLVASCRSDEPASAPSPTKATERAAGERSAARSKKPASRPLEKEAAARAHLQRWLAAQNGGDFDAYAVLYDSGFKGVKRTGKRTQRFDRQGWLADRERMFGKPMKVVADRVIVNSNDKGASIQFVQTWTSPTYEDTGPKRICMVMTEDGMRISSEEMLESRATPALDEWARKSASAAEPTVTTTIGRKVAIELERVVETLVLEDETSRGLDWATALTRDLIAFQFSGGAGPVTAGAPTTTYLVLIRRQDETFEVIDSDTLAGSGLEMFQRTDLDGDGTRDLVFRWSRAGSVESESGLALVLSASGGARIITLGSQGSDRSQRWGVDAADRCVATLGSRRYLIATLTRWVKGAEAATGVREPLVRVFDLDAGLGETTLHGTAIGSGLTVSSAIESAGVKRVGGLVDASDAPRSTRLRPCVGGADPILVMPAATDARSSGVRFQVVRGLDEDETAASRKRQALAREGSRPWSQPPVR